MQTATDATAFAMVGDTFCERFVTHAWSAPNPKLIFPQFMR